jgi:aromatic ring-opening dioxygenase LigB subunit
MISAAAFFPSSPLLVPSINKHERAELEATEEAMTNVAEEWYTKKIETVVIITESRFAYEDSVSIDIADPYLMDLSSLGDLGTQKTYHPDFSLIDAIQRDARRESAPLTLSTEPTLPFGCAASLEVLTKRISPLRIVPIVPGKTCDAKEHYQLGLLLKHAVENSQKRIGILATGDISLAHLGDIRVILEEKSTASLLKLAPELSAHANDTAYHPLSLLFGMLDNMPVRGEILSIESPFDAGYVVATFT